VLITTIVLGGLLSMLGLSGAFAAFTDTAQSGTTSKERIQSASRPKEVDLKVGVPADTNTCQAANDNTTHGVNIPGLPYGTATPVGIVCVRNAGSQPTAVRIQSVAINQIDTACTGDEAVVDTTCGGGGAGELGNVLLQVADANATRSNCTPGTLEGRAETQTFNSHPVYVSSVLEPGQIMCFNYSFELPSGGSDALVAAQSDDVLFRWSFDAVQPSGGSGSTTTTINNF
jgi:hypothetical protein